MVCWKRKNLCWWNLRGFIWGCVLLVITTMMRHVSQSLECNLENTIRGTTKTLSANCKNQYYEILSLPANGQKNCSKIIKGDTDEVRQTLIENLIVKNKKPTVTEADYLTITNNCKLFKENRKYIMFSLSEEEEAFPIAYSMVIHDDIEMFERLLRVIYMPQNVYCVHVDEKATDIFKKAVRAITSCFDNVFVASKLEKVVYASWSRVQADLNCMEDLLKSEVQWKYLINTCGTDFPLKTNKEIVQILKFLNGKNSMESEKPPVYKKWRWEYHFKVTNKVERTTIKKTAPPFHTVIFSGNAYIVVTKEFVKSLFEEPIALQLIEWSNDTYSPDEFLWATLHRIPEMPGYVPANSKYDSSDLNAIARLVKWADLEGDIRKGAPYTECTGKHRRAVCVYGTGDLNWLLQQHHLFANKFDSKVDNHAIQCLEEYLRQKSFY
ncbi:beta-1,3-galactosyl-O-glycosyl-glycoprotein beta-1,6-N-acetylglucosaminyltransferase 3-like [Bombina bombina]|uniref:beta-1,3-galactosyl-O-glycosyl-glycoprotein beta-1,6-N-acetylglucosaminyltransferase 3-like n=1 Tax=Bombina bombina TaxID=8345 RepID=UPI00235A55C9|nr:beta-1,3-galactosyl-O-glycosyl-glycoprotein beta-1,6-N-acetylglucosaminyltransferase 3-like [Bombina bombina]